MRTGAIYTADQQTIHEQLNARPGCGFTDLISAQYGANVVSRVNLARGRLEPTFSLDFAAGAQLYRKEWRSPQIQVQAGNLTGRLKVINFASLISGTAVAKPRSAFAGMRFTI